MPPPLTIPLSHGRCENRKVPPPKIRLSSSSPTFLRSLHRQSPNEHPSTDTPLHLRPPPVPHVFGLCPCRLHSIYFSSGLNLPLLIRPIFPYSSNHRNVQKFRENFFFSHPDADFFCAFTSSPTLRSCSFLLVFSLVFLRNFGALYNFARGSIRHSTSRVQ